MTLSSDVSELLETVRGDSLISARGVMSDRVSEGIVSSGLVDAVTSGLSEIGEGTSAGLAAMAAAIGVSTSRIVDEIRVGNRLIGGIEELLANPLEAAAQERFRRGAHAFERGWNPEAIDEFRAAADSSPYSPAVRFAFGLALVADGDSASAATEFRKAARYAMPDFPSIAAGAVLLGVNALESSGQADEAVEWLAAAVDQFASTPEVQFAHARLAGDEASLRHALTLAPELAVAAVAQVPDWKARAQVSPEPPITAGRIRQKLAEFAQEAPGRPVPSEWSLRLSTTDDVEAYAAAGESFSALRSAMADLLTIHNELLDSEMQHDLRRRRAAEEFERQEQQFAQAQKLYQQQLKEHQAKVKSFERGLGLFHEAADIALYGGGGRSRKDRRSELAWLRANPPTPPSRPVAQPLIDVAFGDSERRRVILDELQTIAGGLERMTPWLGNSPESSGRAQTAEV